jgi:dTDP-4-dehydrorhamnose 3,5-epimerase
MDINYASRDYHRNSPEFKQDIKILAEKLGITQLNQILQKLMIFPEVKVFKQDAFKDHRGELYTVFNQKDHELIFNHDKVSVSKKNVLRGMHGDSKSWKHISCLHGTVFLAVIDYNPKSDNFMKWDSIILSAKNKMSVLLPT